MTKIILTALSMGILLAGLAARGEAQTAPTPLPLATPLPMATPVPFPSIAPIPPASPMPMATATTM